MFLSFYSSAHKLGIDQIKLIEGTRQFLTIGDLPHTQLIHPVLEEENIAWTHGLKSLPVCLAAPPPNYLKNE
jgi:hypothetical protein